MLETAAFSECDEVTDDRPLVQGDIFEWVDRGTDPWRQFGVVVTANCDIAQEKHRGILSYVPFLSLQDYLRLFHFPKLLQRGVQPLANELSKKLLADELAEAIRTYQAANLPEFPEPVSDRAALLWAKSRTPEEIADDLRITGAESRARFINLVVDFKYVDDATTGEGYTEQLSALIRLRTRRGVVPAKAQEAIWGEIHGAIKSLPGDCFFVGRVGSTPSAGWIAYLRLVREIQHRDVAIRQPELRRQGAALAKRVSRLRSPYIYRLTQQLTDVFAAIGLPTEYEDSRAEVLQALASTNTGIETRR
jgi:hypothetical protein